MHARWRGTLSAGRSLRWWFAFVALLLGTLPDAVAAQPFHPAGVPLNYYVVVIRNSFPTVRSPCDPSNCPERPVFGIGPIDSANCAIAGFATAEDAQLY